jgi:CysZ protein
VAAVPALMMLALASVVTVLGVWAGSEMLQWIYGTNRGTWGAIGYWASWLLVIAAVFVSAIMAALTLAQPLSGYALEKVAHAQEFKLTGYRRPQLPYFTSLLLNLRTVLFSLSVGGSALAVLFLITLFFSPAAVVTVPLKFLVWSWMLAWDFLDYPLGLRGLGVGARIRWVLRHFGAFTVYGALWAAVCIVPGIALLLLPMGVAGATRLVLRDDPGRRWDERIRA